MKKHYSVYVVELDPRVWNHTRFRAANPGHDITKPCVYVGMTGLAITERLLNHQRGYKSNSFVKRYGVRLLPNLYARLNPMSHRMAVLTEVMLAEKLRNDGYAVWQA